MKNIVLSFVLFIALVCSLFYLNFKFIKICDVIIFESSEIESHINNDDIDLAYNTAVDLLEFLNDNNSIASLYLNHADYDVLINECLKVCIYLDNNELSEAQASVHLVNYSSKHLKEIQKISIKNIF